MNPTDLGVLKRSATVEGQIQWKTLVTNILVEVYGRNLIHYSASGHRVSSKPGIDKRLYRGLYSKLIKSSNKTRWQKSLFG